MDKESSTIFKVKWKGHLHDPLADLGTTHAAQRNEMHHSPWVTENKGNSNPTEPVEDWNSQKTSEWRALYSWKKRMPGEMKQ